VENFIHKLYNQDILDQAILLYGIQPDSVNLISKSESYVYEGKRKGEPVILRITHSSHRNVDQMLGELEWINHLSNHNISVATPIRSNSGLLIELIPLDDTYFLVSSFQKAKGRKTQISDWQPTFFQHWGSFVGKMHALAKQFQPSHQSLRRPHWHEEYNVAAIEQVLPDQPHIIQKQKELLAYLIRLPKTSIHTE
jgi:Ser/Thr protein kinase RdoA (MazF antagonist)